MRRKLTMVFTLLVIASCSFAQNRRVKSGLSSGSYYFNNAIGLRAGGTSGLTFKHFTSSNEAFEGILNIHGNGAMGFSLTLLYEKYTRAFDEVGFNWYYGFGGHVAGFESGYYYSKLYGDPYRNNRNYRYYTNGGFGVGIDGVVGLEYKIKPAPIALSLDLKPFFEVNTRGYSILALDPGLGIKVTF